MSNIKTLEQKRAALAFSMAKLRAAPVWQKPQAAEQVAEAANDALSTLIDFEIQRQQERATK